MNTYRLGIGIMLLMLAQCALAQHGQLVWNDEFDTDGKPDTEKWSFDLGDGCPNLCGWGNNELQTYTNKKSNVRQQDGKLIIEAHPQKGKPGKYTSARLVTKSKGDWQYGYIEVRARLPYGKGTWPAIWMLPTMNGGFEWPKDGEIDIMEHVGYDQNVIVGTIHTNAYNHMIGTEKTASVKVYDAHKHFYNYGLYWTPKKLEWSVNGVVYHTIEKNDDDYNGWPFDKPFHLVMNLAVGGNWGGRHGVDADIWPQRLEVDYVRVYRSDLTAGQ